MAVREGGCINTYEQQVADGGDRVVIYYHPQDLGRGGHGASWAVGHFVGGKAKVTDPNAAWYDNKLKTFVVFEPHNVSHSVRKKYALVKALTWAMAKYGKREFVGNRMGDMVEKEVNERFPLRKREKRSNGSSD